MALEKMRWLEFWALLAVGTCDSSIVRLEIENVRELEGVMRVLPSNHATVERGFASRTGKSLSLEIGAWSHLQILKLKSIGLRGTWARAQAEHAESIRTHMRNVPRAFLCTGAIPASIGGLNNLQDLYLNNNELAGTAAWFFLCCST